jgi:molybdate transport system substrate-binding protein
MAQAEVSLLSAGAVKPGLVKVIDTFQSASGHKVNLAFATAPAIVKRIDGGEPVDVVIAPEAVLNKLENSGKIAAAERITVGRIGVGVLVRAGALHPKISSVEELKQSLLSATSLVYNQASTGLYLETLFDRLGIGAELKAKSTIYPDFSGVLEHISQAKSTEIGFGATTVIIENQAKGVAFVGPLPAEIQNYTTYAAALNVDSTAKAPAQEFIGYLASSMSKSLFAAAGIE